MIGGRSPATRAEARIRAVFGDRDGLERGRLWAVETLSREGLDPRKRPLRSVRALCRAQSGLGPTAARYLVEAAAGRLSARPSGPPSPHLD